MNSKCCNHAPCQNNHPLPTKALFSCGQGTSVSLPIPTVSTPGFTPVTIASLTIDTSALCNPSVKIDFNSLINYQVAMAAGSTLSSPFTITFQLNKINSCGTKIAVGSWDYAYGTTATATNLTNSFGFSYCECNVCPACYVYTIEVINVSSIGVSSSVTQSSTIRSSSISAMAVSH